MKQDVSPTSNRGNMIGVNSNNETGNGASTVQSSVRCGEVVGLSQSIQESKTLQCQM